MQTGNWYIRTSNYFVNFSYCVSQLGFIRNFAFLKHSKAQVVKTIWINANGKGRRDIHKDLQNIVLKSEFKLLGVHM